MSHNVVIDGISYVPANEPKDCDGKTMAPGDHVYIRQSALASLGVEWKGLVVDRNFCLLYTSPSPRDRTRSRMPSSA